MEKVKETKEHRIFKKKSGRYCILDLKTRKYVHAALKVEILLAHGLIKMMEKKKEDTAAPAAE